jgi:zinc/manganese transport system substrate-binding protein
MSRILSILVAVALALVMAPRVARADLVVVATVPSLAALAKEVGGSKVTVQSLALPTQDPHFVDAKPNLVLELSKADMLLAIGLHLEGGWLPTLQLSARNAKIATGSKGYLEVAQFVRLLDVHAHADRSHGDIHPGGNPHFLYDPRAGLAVARGIAARMKELDPNGAAAYDQNLKAFEARLDVAKKRWDGRLAGFRGAPVIGYHATWSYVAEWIGLNQVEFLEPKPGVPPNPGHVAKVLVAARKHGVRAIVQESYYPDATSKLVAEKSGAKLVIVPGGADFRGGQSYVDHVEQVVGLLEKGLSK